MYSQQWRAALPVKGHGVALKLQGSIKLCHNDYLKSEGLYSLRDGWIKLHYPE